MKGEITLLYYFLGAFKVTALTWMQHLKFEHSPFKLGVNQSRFEKLQGEDSLNVTLNGRSHQQQPWGAQRRPSWSTSLRELSVFVSFWSTTVPFPLSKNETTHRKTKYSLQPLRLLDLLHYCMVQCAKL